MRFLTALPLPLLAGLLLAPPALAEDLSPETVARIQMEEKAAQDKVNDAHGNKLPSQLSPSERQQIAEEQREATRRELRSEARPSKTREVLAR